MARTGASGRPGWAASGVWVLAGLVLPGTGCQQAGEPGTASTSLARQQTSVAGSGPALQAITTHVRRDAGAPVFAWEPVAGASDYAVLVYAASAPAPQWIWIGSQTQVRYGSLPANLSDAAMSGTPATWAPALDPAAEWQVLAMDANGSALAMSQRGILP